MKYFDAESNMFFPDQNAAATLQPYDDEYFAGVYERARGGERIDVDGLQVPSFIDRELLQKSLLLAYLFYLRNAGGDADLPVIAELEAALFPVQESQPEGDE